MDNKDIYKILNEIDFDINNEEEIELTDIEKIKLKKDMRKRVKINKGIVNNKRIISVAIIALIIVSFGISPWGKAVIAEIKEKLIFTPSRGLINGEENKELYVMEEPKRVNISGNEILLKSVENDGKYIRVHFDETPWSEIEDIKSNIKFKTKNNKTIEADEMLNGMSNSNIAGLWHLFIGFEQGEETITEFDLYYKDEMLASIVLEKVEVLNGYDEVGGNATDKDIMIGGTSYYVEGKRHFKIWSNIDSSETEKSNLHIQEIKDIEVRDNENNILEIQWADDGSGRGYELLSNYTGPLNITIKRVSVERDIKNIPKLSLEIPKEGESIELNKEVLFDEIGEKIIVTSIKKQNDDIIINFKFSKNEEEDRFIYMVMSGGRSGGAMGDMELLIGDVNIDARDLTLSEKLIGKVKLNLKKIDIMQEGNWEFTIE